MTWKPKKLDELGFVGRGKSKHRPRDAAHLYGGDYPFIQTGDVKHSSLYVNSYSQTYSEEGLAQSKLWKKGTLCITIAANIADTAILGIDACFPDSVLGFIADENECDVRFIKYKFDILQSQFQQFSQGAAQDNLSVEKLLSLDFHVPNVETQKRIAEILSAYDDLIENNLKRIRLLEESARLLYREWFVRLKFPNHEHTPLIDGLPEGWRMGNVGDLAKVQSGFAFKSSDWMPEGNPVIKIKNLGGNTINLDSCECVSDEVAEKATRFLLKEGDLLFAMSGATVGKFGLMPRSQSKYYLNQRVGILRPLNDLNPNPFLFTFLNSENAQQQVKNFASGAAQPNISPGQIEAIKLLLPSEKVLEDYLEFCEPMFKQKNSLLEQNQKLKQARDLLLPRLMSGEIAV